MFQNTFSATVSVIMILGIVFCMIAVPYMALQHKVNKKALDALEALNGTRSQAD